MIVSSGDLFSGEVSYRLYYKENSTDIWIEFGSTSEEEFSWVNSIEDGQYVIKVDALVDGYFARSLINSTFEKKKFILTAPSILSPINGSTLGDITIINILMTAIDTEKINLLFRFEYRLIGSPVWSLLYEGIDFDETELENNTARFELNFSALLDDDYVLKITAYNTDYNLNNSTSILFSIDRSVITSTTMMMKHQVMKWYHQQLMKIVRLQLLRLHQVPQSYLLNIVIRFMFQ